MFTPLQRDPTFSPFASFRNFNITVNDACENYFMGYRGDSERSYKAPWWLTAGRVTSYFTVVIPVIVSMAFIISSLLLTSSTEERQFWEEIKEDLESQQENDTSRLQLERIEDAGSRNHYVTVLSHSGIKSTDFKHVCFLRGGGGGARGFQADGVLSHLRNSMPKLLIRNRFGYRSPSIWTIKAANKRLDGIYDSSLGQEDYKYATVCTATKIDDILFFLFGKVSNRLKERIILGPEEKIEESRGGEETVEESQEEVEITQKPFSIAHGVKITAAAIGIISVLGVLLAIGGVGGMAILGAQSGAPFFMYTVSAWLSPFLGGSLPYLMLVPGGVGGLSLFAFTTYGAFKSVQSCFLQKKLSLSVQK